MRNIGYEIAQHLTSRRRVAGITPEFMAKSLGWSLKKLECFEEGDINLKLKDIRHYAKAFGIDVQISFAPEPPLAMWPN